MKTINLKNTFAKCNVYWTDSTFYYLEIPEKSNAVEHVERFKRDEDGALIMRETPRQGFVEYQLQYAESAMPKDETYSAFLKLLRKNIRGGESVSPLKRSNDKVKFLRNIGTKHILTIE